MKKKLLLVQENKQKYKLALSKLDTEIGEYVERIGRDFLVNTVDPLNSEQ